MAFLCLRLVRFGFCCVLRILRLPLVEMSARRIYSSPRPPFSRFSRVCPILIENIIIALSKSLWIHEAIAEWIHRLLSIDNVMTKFIVNNRADALKTGINSFFTITNCKIVHSRSLAHCINYKFICLSA